ncbi:MAG: 5-oxoprolinase subunit PxpB [Saprospiraceae bacterium]
MVPKIFPLSETALLVQWGEQIEDALHQKVLDLNHLLNQMPFAGFVETVPAYASLAVYYQPEKIESEGGSPFQYVKSHLEALLGNKIAQVSQPKDLVSIPVCYDHAFGHDLDQVADAHGISPESLIALHQQREYKVYMMGFLPGFAYLGTLDAAIATARKPSPRARVEAGSVGIAGNQTGIYPLASPGGWQIIGRTPFCLFDPEKASPFLLKTGDSVRFFAISKEEFQEMSLTKNEVPIPTDSLPQADAQLLKPGIYSTIQDLGRFGFRASGVPISGAMDLPALYTANALLCNTENAATIECTMGGLLMQSNKNTHIALTGAGTALINQSNVPLYQRLAVFKNDVLEIRYNPLGIRTYLAVRGGFQAASRMNSKSVCPGAGIGSPLKKEDGLWFDKEHRSEFGTVAPLQAAPHLSCIRVCPGPEQDWMSTESVRRFYAQPFTLSNRCDRMGFHLQADPLLMNEPREMLSSAVTKGTLQLTPSGQLILLMNDCQTTGGYPRVGQVAAVDLPAVAQLSPGECITFTPVSFAEAEALYLQQQKAMHALFS